MQILIPHNSAFLSFILLKCINLSISNLSTKLPLTLLYINMCVWITLLLHYAFELKFYMFNNAKNILRVGLEIDTRYFWEWEKFRLSLFSQGFSSSRIYPGHWKEERFFSFFPLLLCVYFCCHTLVYITIWILQLVQFLVSLIVRLFNMVLCFYLIILSVIV